MENNAIETLVVGRRAPVRYYKYNNEWSSRVPNALQQNILKGGSDMFGHQLPNVYLPPRAFQGAQGALVLNQPKIPWLRHDNICPD